MIASSGEPTAIEAPGVRVTHAQLAADGFDLRGRVVRGGQAAVRDSGAVGVAAAIRALDGWASDVFLVGGLEPELPDAVVSLGPEIFASASAAAPRRRTAEDGARASTRWHVFTSGTTGEPRGVSHTLGSLSRTARSRQRLQQRRWGLLYDPTRMAGIQVILQGLAAVETILDATRQPHLRDRIDWLAGSGVDALSATPTLWRQILQSPRAGALQLEQITLGGEIADQQVLRALRRAYPHARITHIFAATETGVAFSVSDGLEGFPCSFLTDPPSGIRLDVRDGILFVEAPDASTAGRDGFASTGDAVAVGGDRVLFLGRASGAVNVGGVKVWPERVESVLREHPDVTDTIVVPRRSPISGWILTADVVAASTDESTLPERLRRFCAERLETAAVPAVVKVVPVLRTSATGKVGRS